MTMTTGIQSLMIATCVVLFGCDSQAITTTSSGANISGSTNHAAIGQSSSRNMDLTDRARTIGQYTQNYWNRCIQINEQFVSTKQELWLKSIRPGEIGKALRETASELRNLEQSNVDAIVIEHVNAVTRGYEDMAGIIEKEGKIAIWNEAATIGLFLLEIAITRRQSDPTNGRGAVADAGNIPVGVGSFSESAFNFRNAAEGQIKNRAMELIDSEVAVIRHIRETYGVNLKPW